MDNINYTVDELIHNQSFRDMVNGTADPEETDKWQCWIKENEQNRERAKEAIAEIVGFEFRKPDTPSVETEWHRLYKSTIGKSGKTQQLGSNQKGTALKWIYRAVAIFLVFSMVAIGIYLNETGSSQTTELKQITQQKVVSTGADEQKTLAFSNGARIILNKNSKITYNLGLLHGETISVTLEGEAFFESNTASGDEPAFAVTTPDGVIRDIGTKFLVTIKKDHSRIILQEGNVEVQAIDNTNVQREFQVAKGEMVEFNKTDVLSKSTVNSTFYTSWATGMMQFDNTPLPKFAELVTQRFGVNVEFLDSMHTDLTLDGAVYFRSLEELVRNVSKAAQISVYQSSDRDTIYIAN